MKTFGTHFSFMMHYNDERIMKKIALFAIILLLALTGYFFEPRNTETAALPAASQLAHVATSVAQVATATLAPNTYPVIKVVDGDTLAVLMDGKSVTLRLIGLDTPETVDPRKPVQCFGQAARDMAKQILSGTDVRLEFDPSQGMLDKYGRTLAYVYVPANSKPEGILFNEYMIAEGYGHEYTYNLPYKYQKEFKAAEGRAREEKRGLWADDACAGNTKKPAAS